MKSKYRKIFHISAFGLLLTIILFLLNGIPGANEDDRRVIFTESDVAQVIARFMRTWNRPPTEEELRIGFQNYVRDEILYREALARNLDEYDQKVRLALIQKITMMGTIAAESADYSDQDIEAFFALRKERYRIPERISLIQVLLKSDDGIEKISRKANDLLELLREEDPQPELIYKYGDPSMLENQYVSVSEEDLGGLFGDIFGSEVMRLELGEWSGPVESSYGLHIVKIIDRTESRIPELKEVLSRVVSDMRYENRNAAEDQFYSEIAPLYQVQFDEATRRLVEGGEE
jgi:peptidyl-prolyl cis-trans isomerase C